MTSMTSAYNKVLQGMLGRNNGTQPEHLPLLMSNIPQVMTSEGGVPLPHTSLHHLLNREVTREKDGGAKGPRLSRSGMIRRSSPR